MVLFTIAQVLANKKFIIKVRGRVFECNTLEVETDFISSNFKLLIRTCSKIVKMTVFLLWTFTTLCSREGVARLIFADLTTNRFTRSLDGTLGMWSYHGIAKESKASQTRFIFNGDLIDEDLFHQGISFHPDIATTSIPYLGLTSDSDVDYLLYQILQAKTAGIDGFMVEWGFKAHPSDRTLKRILHVLERYRTWVHGFKIGINWCDHWLTMHLRNSSLEEVLLSFKTNLQYLIDSVYSPFFDFTLTYSGRPVIFLFGGGLTVDLFKDLQMQPLKLPGYLNRPIWIGNYLNTGSSACLRLILPEVIMIFRILPIIISLTLRVPAVLCILHTSSLCIGLFLARTTHVKKSQACYRLNHYEILITYQLSRFIHVLVIC
ncbi:uncharacterized protein LOC143233764 isoform X2 [Tachypleus tridentatus]|uniref:uncharacterized protein LOC143233764 isoform X2 n=1 Tax=Tachypleus tridentatus TaxID=6853 RepID=UPI003FD21D77